MRLNVIERTGDSDRRTTRWSPLAGSTVQARPLPTGHDSDPPGPPASSPSPAALRQTKAADAPPWASAPARSAGLTPREWEVLGLLLMGSSNRGIAETLHLSPNTVLRHVTNVLGKLQASSRGEAVARALGLAGAVARAAAVL